MTFARRLRLTYLGVVVFGAASVVVGLLPGQSYLSNGERTTVATSDFGFAGFMLVFITVSGVLVLTRQRRSVVIWPLWTMLCGIAYLFYYLRFGPYVLANTETLWPLRVWWACISTIAVLIFLVAPVAALFPDRSETTTVPRAAVRRAKPRT
jgi:hypothetical protein